MFNHLDNIFLNENGLELNAGLDEVGRISSLVCRSS